MKSKNGVAPGITPNGASAVLKRPNISVDTCPKSAKRPKVSSEEASLLSLDGLPLVLVLVFLVDAPDGVEKASSDYPPPSAPSAEPTSCGSDSAGPDGNISLDVRSGTIPPRRCLIRPACPATHHPSFGISNTTRPRPTQRGTPSRSRSLRALLSVAARGSILSSRLPTGRNALKFGCQDYNIPPRTR